MFISSGISEHDDSDNPVAHACSRYQLSYSLDEWSEPHETRISLRTVDISCEITNSAMFWTISPMLPPTANYITWSFGNDVLEDHPKGRFLTLEVVDQRGEYAKSTPFYAQKSLDNGTDCFGLSRTSPLYHAPLDEREAVENRTHESSPRWVSCVPPRYLNLNDRYSDASSADSVDKSLLLKAFLIPVGIALLLLLITLYLWNARRRRRAKTAKFGESPAMKRASNRPSISKQNEPNVAVPLDTFNRNSESHLESQRKDSGVPLYYTIHH